MMCVVRFPLSRIFRLSVSSVGHQINYMLFQIMKYVVAWLPRSPTANGTPSFLIKSGCDSSTCILDSTEVTLQHTKKLMARAQTYSSCKAHNTELSCGDCTKWIHYVHF